MKAEIYKKLLPTRENWFGWSVLVLSMLIAFVWVCCTPLATDDFAFRFIYQNCKDLGDISEGPQYNLPFYKFPYAIYSCMLRENGRLGNYLYLFAVPYPVWLVKAFIGLCFSSFIFLLFNWAKNLRLRNTLISLLMPIFIWLGFPWEQQFQSSDFMFNYMLPSLLMLGVMILFLRDKKPSTWSWILLAIFALWHEGFTSVLAAFTFVFYVSYREKKYLWMLAVLILGFIAQMTPGILERINGEFNSSNYEFKIFSFWELWTSVVAILLWAILRKNFNKKERKFIDTYGLGFLLGWIIMFIILVCVKPSQRAHWPINILAICFILRLLGSIKRKRVSISMLILYLAIYSVWGTSLIFYQIKVRNIAYNFIQHIEDGNMTFEDDADYSELIIPFYITRFLRVPYGYLNYSQNSMLSYYSTNIHKARNSIVVLPKEYYDKKIDEWPVVPGNTQLRYIYPATLLRPLTAEDKVSEYEVVFDKPNIANGLKSWLLYWLNGMQPEKVIMKKENSLKAVHRGDSLEFLYLFTPDDRFENRRILSINAIENNAVDNGK